jgi:hypothetical protein
MCLRVTLPKFLIVLFCLLLVNIAVISVGDDAKSYLTVVNKTTHYLHVIVDEKPYLYVSPDKSITHTTEAKPSMLVKVFYSPGQGISGSAIQTIDVYYRSASTDCICNEEQQHDECVYNPPAGGSERWEVTPEDLQ